MWFQTWYSEIGGEVVTRSHGNTIYTMFQQTGFGNRQDKNQSKSVFFPFPIFTQNLIMTQTPIFDASRYEELNPSENSPGEP